MILGVVTFDYWGRDLRDSHTFGVGTLRDSRDSWGRDLERLTGLLES